MIIKLGIIREGKVPPDKRVPLTPKQCVQITEKYPNLKIVVQKSPIRAFNDYEYRRAGVEVTNSLHDCDLIFGVKEVNIDDLIPNKHFFFFSHTIKKQEYNKPLLQAIIDKKIQLTDYELLKDENGKRIIGFGKYAGIVGCYNAFLTYGLKHSIYNIKPAHKCFDRKEMEGELLKIKLPENIKIVITGNGRVARGVLEIIKKLPIREVSPADFLNRNLDFPVFTHLSTQDYIARDDGKNFNKYEFYKNSSGHHSTFLRYLKAADIYIAAHYWKSGSPYFFTKYDLKQNEIKTTVIADISCDIDGPIASTIRASTIINPIYGYHPKTEKETDFLDEDAIAVMAIDNLPCELPKDSSEYFGNELINNVFPLLFESDPHRIIEKATETKNGSLMPDFKYLEGFLAEK